MPDGVTAIAMGYLGGYRAPLLIVGGNCSIQGFDWKGEELYWTVTGDVVRSMILTDIDHDGTNEVRNPSSGRLIEPHSCTHCSSSSFAVNRRLR